MLKTNQLDPRHTSLLNDHSSGYWWFRPTNAPDKYKGRIMFSDDFARDFLLGINRKISLRRIHHQLITFKTHGYIYSGIDFIKLLKCKEASDKMMGKANEARAKLIKQWKTEARAVAITKTLLKKYGSKYKGPKHPRKNIGSKGERTLWIWGFENKQLGLSYPHIFHFIDFGAQLGKSRREFAEYYGLSYACLQFLSQGKIKAHRGWTLIGEPRKITHRQAIVWKIKILQE